MCLLWVSTLDSTGFRSCCVQWDKAVRKVLPLPYRTHTWLLGPLMDQCHIAVQLHIKEFVCSLVRHNANSPIGLNESFF